MSRLLQEIKLHVELAGLLRLGLNLRHTVRCYRLLQRKKRFNLFDRSKIPVCHLGLAAQLDRERLTVIPVLKPVFE